MRKHNTVLLLTALLFFVGTAHATVWYVHPDSVMDCIQDALDSCSTGDTVLVGPGIYYEHIEWPSTQGIDLTSEYGVDMTYIDGGGIGRVIRIGIAVDQTTVIQGFTVQNGYDAVGGGGIDCAYGASPTIRGNVITNNVADNVGAGIVCAYGSSPLIDSNTVANNTSYFAGGIGCWDGSHPTIHNNTIIDNVASFGAGGIGADTTSSPIIRNNTITNNAAMWGAGIGLWAYGVIVGNTISGNIADSMGGGIYCDSISTARVDSNVIDSNTAQMGGGISCGPGTSPTIFGNIISYNTGNGYATGGGGIFTYGASPAITGNDISYNNSPNSGGGGILCTYNSNPIIANNTITNNTCAAGGGGVLIYVDCAPTITDNIVTNNTAGSSGGGLCLQTTISSVTGNTVTNNTALANPNGIGGGIYTTQYDSSTITWNTITNNTAVIGGGGISCKTGSAPHIEHCTIANNDGDGVYCYENGNPVINYNDIIDNIGYGVRNISSITINAEYNWWGDSTGPYHPTTNPDGLGDTVSDYVDFDPWLGEPGITEYTASSLLILKLQVTPNPFTHFADIRYQMADNGYREQEFWNSNFEMRKPVMKIYDISGRLVKDFDLSSVIGHSSVRWYGDDNAGAKLPAGTYFCRIIVGERSIIEKAILIK